MFHLGKKHSLRHLNQLFLLHLLVIFVLISNWQSGNPYAFMPLFLGIIVGVIAVLLINGWLGLVVGSIALVIGMVGSYRALK